MKIHKVEDFTKGWFIGNFKPTLFNTDEFEVCIKYYKQGDYDTRHVHKIATEYTAIIEGTVEMNGVEYKKGDLIEIFPGDYTDFRAITEASTVVVKVPCVKGDKYE